VADPEDEFVWLGSRQGQAVTGHRTPGVETLATGDVDGDRLGTEPGERFRVAVRDLGDLRLVTGQSYEESDAIGRAVLEAFGTATAVLLVLAALGAALLSRRAQQRLDRISNTLAEVALGNMHRRVPLSGSGDDLDRLSTRINDALAQLETTVEGIRQVSVDIAHDLRTPISRLGIRLEELLAEAGSQPVLRDRLETASAEIRQITATFDSLLRIAQIEAGARKSRFQPVALADIGASLYEAYLPVAEESQQQLELKIASAAPALVYGDRDLLTQLFANLVENALKHCSAGASIRLEVGSRDGDIYMSVADNGPGIPAGERINVTRRFYRLDKSRQSPGSGLGLALVKAISDLHGATLALDDNAPGLVVRLSFEPYRPTRTG
jgi:signal transduction histidine kinase